MDQQRVIAAWMNKAGRRYVEWPIFVSDAQDERVAALLSELSHDGCQLQLEQPLEIGDEVVLVHPELGELEAEVRWWTGGRAGLRFTDGVRDASRTAAVQRG